MGAISFGLDLNLAAKLKSLLALRFFAETGTFEGDTLASALPLFDRCYSVELSQEYFLRASNRFAQEPKVRLLPGDAPAALAAWRPDLEREPCLYFLDAHWCAGDHTSGSGSQCHLLDELRAIGSLNHQSVIVIDDARLFVAPPPAPQDPSQWPSFDQVLDALRRTSSNHRLAVWNDVILFFPAHIADQLLPWLAEQGTDWLKLTSQAKADSVAAAERDLELRRKESEIQTLSAACNERLAVIERLATQLDVLQPRLQLTEWTW